MSLIHDVLVYYSHILGIVGRGLISSDFHQQSVAVVQQTFFEPFFFSVESLVRLIYCRQFCVFGHAQCDIKLSYKLYIFVWRDDDGDSTRHFQFFSIMVVVSSAASLNIMMVQVHKVYRFETTTTCRFSYSILDGSFELLRAMNTSDLHGKRIYLRCWCLKCSQRLSHKTEVAT